MDISNLFNPGLYIITCLKNKKTYIGQSSNVFHRLGRHASDLESNRHDCYQLQTDFNHYGKECFKFESLELNIGCLQERLKKEKCMIKKNKNSYNVDNKKIWINYSQHVKIKNKIYSSLRQAAKLTGESRTNLTRKCKHVKINDYVFLDKKTTGKKSISVIINGVKYESIREAAACLKKSPATIRRRCYSKQYLNYNMLS